MFQKLELTAEENNKHPGQLTRITFEVLLSFYIPPVMVDGYTSLFHCHFYKGKQLCNFLFASLDDQTLPESVLLRMERIC